MSTRPPRVFNIAPGGNFLDVLAKNILEGFPLENSEIRPALSSWTILLPTRRAVRELSHTLLKKSGQKAILLPRIRPIGDLDDEMPNDDGLNLPDAISSTGQFFLLFSLLKKWSQDNPLIALAKEITNSPSQTVALTTSLLKLVNQGETEEVGFENLNDAYDADLSDHRQTILSLLSTIKFALPQKLYDENLLGPQERRSRLIHLQAQRIRSGQLKGPIIAAGSTGTIPATRDLLKAIANQSNGAVILPGYDVFMEDESWDALKLDHPQFALKKLIESIEITRAEIVELSQGHKNRNFLSSELMRPTEQAHLWRNAISVNKAALEVALENLHLIQAPDRHLEARAIALILRNALETPNQTAALVTPDRDLARRVKSELMRWNIAIDDTAGEPLTKSGLASLAQVLAEVVLNKFDGAALLTLLYHHDCDLGLSRENIRRSLRHIELVVFRNYGVVVGLSGLQSGFDRARMAFTNNERAHPLVRKLTEDDWHQMQILLHHIIAILKPLESSESLPFKDQLQIFLSVLLSCASNANVVSPENQAFVQIKTELEAQAHRIPPCDFTTVSTLILSILRNESFKSEVNLHPRLAIYGLLEARMMPAEILIMGGLNETKWPAQPDPGPWLNRPMRNVLGLQQPEREIGVSAHDFTQGLGYAKVYLTYSKRVEGAPLLPSRWILRLQAVLQVAGMWSALNAGEDWIDLAKAIDEADVLQPTAKPKPKPKIEARPKRISVTEVEKLIRDPYSVYARRILKLEPLPQLARQADAALRGTLFHEAVHAWNNQQRVHFSSDSLEVLLNCGRNIFAAYVGDPEISSFWWPRFEKMSQWLVKNENNYRFDVRQIHTELAGEIELKIGDETHVLSGRADRIDILSNGHARIIDYKTGIPPSSKQVTSGLNPQLPLEAAILAGGKFETLMPTKTDLLDYIQISGGSTPGEIEPIIPSDGSTVAELAERHLTGLRLLLSSYSNSNQAYLPRVAPVKEEGELEYDHLSRFREWMLAGSIT